MNSNTGIETLLLVEDDAADAELALHIIKEKIPSLHVIVARNGSEALEFIYPENQPSFDPSLHTLRAVVLDLHMPGIDGFEVLYRMKSNISTKTLPVVVLTSSQEPKDIERCYMLGVNSYVVKPIVMEEYENVIKEIITYWLEINEAPASHAPFVFTGKRGA